MIIGFEPPVSSNVANTKAPPIGSIGIHGSMASSGISELCRYASAEENPEWESYQQLDQGEHYYYGTSYISQY